MGDWWLPALGGCDIYILLTISGFQNDKDVYILPQEYVRQFPVDLQPPVHMAITYGPVKIVNKKDNNKDKESQETEDCLPAFGGLPRCNVCSKKTKVTFVCLPGGNSLDQI